MTGCSSRQATSIADIENLPQNAFEYDMQTPATNSNFFIQASKQYKQHFFAPWQRTQMSKPLEDVTWGHTYTQQKVYGMNHQRISKEWFDTHIQNENFKDFNTLNKPAITINNTSLRVFPTHLPLFYNPKKAGEGFPFDYNQNSGIKINTPLFISHFSQDKKWVFVESGFAFGWVEAQNIAFVTPKIMNAFKQSQHYVSIKDDFPIYKNGVFKQSIKLGTFFPKSQYGNFFVVNHYQNLQGYIQTVQIPKTSLTNFPLSFSKEHIQYVVNELINEPYGWGESFQKRDCSALTKDFFALFGLYLHRNSSQQIKNGTYISLKHLNNEQKKAYIKEHAQPFLTLIYLKGHIMIYAGVSKNEPLVFHNFWGIKTKNSWREEERFVVGKSALTTLEPGKELPGYDATKNILSKIEGMVLLMPVN